MNEYCPKCGKIKFLIQEIECEGESQPYHCSSCGDLIILEKTDFKKQAGGEYNSGESMD